MRRNGVERGGLMKAKALITMTPQQFQQLQRDYIVAITPILTALTNLRNLCIPKIILYPNGKIEYKYNYVYRKAEQQAYEIIETIQKQFFGEQDDLPRQNLPSQTLHSRYQKRR